MKNKKYLYIIMALAGITLLLLGAFVFNSEERMIFAGMCFGLGSVLAVFGIGNFVQTLIISDTKYTEIKKAQDIEINDERNIRIREKSGYMVAKVMNYLLCAFVLFLGFSKADLHIILIATFLIVVEFILLIAFSNHYSKKL